MSHVALEAIPGRPIPSSTGVDDEAADADQDALEVDESVPELWPIHECMVRSVGATFHLNIK